MSIRFQVGVDVALRYKFVDDVVSLGLFASHNSWIAPRPVNNPGN